MAGRKPGKRMKGDEDRRAGSKWAYLQEALLFFAGTLPGLFQKTVIQLPGMAEQHIYRKQYIPIRKNTTGFFFQSTLFRIMPIQAIILQSLNSPG